MRAIPGEIKMLIGLLAVILIPIVPLIIDWEPDEYSVILEGGGFQKAFERGLYPSREEAIKEWFGEELSGSNTFAVARQVLSRSFSVDLTSGEKVVIDRYEKFPAGGQWTKIRLRFSPTGSFEEAEVEQHYAWL